MPTATSGFLQWKRSAPPASTCSACSMSPRRRVWNSATGSGPSARGCRGGPFSFTTSEVENLIAAHPDVSIETLYVTGGGSELPAVARVLKETFGRAVRRSAYMRSATAIGLAISADSNSGYVLRDRFARHFGVWREADHGRAVVFDVLFPRGLELPRVGAAPLRVVRHYRPVHNIGHFRYAEAARI